MDVKHVLKRGALLTAANWPVVAIQFVAEMTFQVLLAVPIVGAAILVAVLLGGDIGELLQGSLRDSFTTVASTLMSEPVALVAFIASFGVALFGGSALTFVVKAGTMEVLLAANAVSGPIEHEPLTIDLMRTSSSFTVERFMRGCARLWRPYLALGVTLMMVYVVSVVGYLSVVVSGYPSSAGGRIVLIAWTLVAAMGGTVLVAWFTLVNVLYLLVQVAIAVEGVGVFEGVRTVARFIRSTFRELAAIFLVVLALVIGATLASALAWSGVGLVAFVPLVGLAVFPLQLAALVVRGLVFQFLGLTALGAYITLYGRQSRSAQAVANASPASAQA